MQQVEQREIKYQSAEYSFSALSCNRSRGKVQNLICDRLEDQDYILVYGRTVQKSDIGGGKKLVVQALKLLYLLPVGSLEKRG